MKTWTVKISVTENWLSDGFDLTPGKLQESILETLLPWGTQAEVKVEILGVQESPDPT